MDVPISTSVTVATPDELFSANEQLALAGFLAGYSGLTRDAYTLDLRQYVAWSTEHHLEVFGARRADIECYARHLESLGRARTTIARRLCTVSCFHRYAEQEGLIAISPAAHVRRPRLDYESHATGLDRNEVGAMLVAAALAGARDHALISLLALNGLRVSEALGVDIEDLGLERGHRTLTILRKGGKVVTIPMAPRTARAIDLAVGERCQGPLRRIQRQADRPPRGGTDRAPHRPTSRHCQTCRGFTRSAMLSSPPRLDAGVPLRVVQEAASHSDPRTTMRYDRARGPSTATPPTSSPRSSLAPAADPSARSARDIAPERAMCAALARTGLVLVTRRDALMPHDGNRPRPSDRPRSMRLTLALMLVVAGTAGACGERSTAGRDDQWETYTSDIDGVVVSYPTTWRRPEDPLAGALTGDQFEVLGLVTGELPEGERGCSPYPWAAMRALGAGDLVLTLRVSAQVGGRFDEWAETGREPLASKPDDLLDQEPMPPGELPGGCAVDGVEQRQVNFIAHGRLYTAFLAHSGTLSEQRREELSAVWSSLTLRPIPTGDQSATIGERYWHVLYTHCGIAGTEFAGRDWVAEPVLEDGNGNPPAGWGNPVQPGVMALTSPDHAEFESRDGALKATFRPRTPADPPGQPCA